MTRAIAVRSPAPAATMPWPSQRSEWNHMYQLTFLCGFSDQLMFPEPFPTLYGAYGAQVKMSWYRFAKVFGRSMPLKPWHA